MGLDEDADTDVTMWANATRCEAGNVVELTDTQRSCVEGAAKVLSAQDYKLDNALRRQAFYRRNGAECASFFLDLLNVV